MKEVSCFRLCLCFLLLFWEVRLDAFGKKLSVFLL